MRSVATLSVARTWRISSAAEPIAGSEGALTLHVGQPVASGSLLVSVLPLKRKPFSEPAHEEKLEQSIGIKSQLAKGATRTIKYGPVCRAGAHVVSVTLNGAHVVGSPLHITVHPSPAEPGKCELRPLTGSSATAMPLSAGAIKAAGLPNLPGGVYYHEGVATEEIVVGLQLRDRYANRCTLQAAAEVNAVQGSVRIMVRRQRTVNDGGGARDKVDSLGKDDAEAAHVETGFDKSTQEPKALLPPSGTDAAAESVSSRITLAADEQQQALIKAKKGAKIRGEDGRAHGSGAVAARGLLCVRLNIARAGIHLVTAALNGTLLPTSVIILVKPGPPRASSSTAHDVIENECTALTRCIAGVPRQLRLVARDARGNATACPASKWEVSLRSAACDDTFQLYGANRSIDDYSEEGVTPSPPKELGFTSTIDVSDAFSPATAILTYNVDLPGEHELCLRLHGRYIGSSPTVLTALVPAWGPGLNEAIAGEQAVLYVRIRPEGSAVPGSASGRKLMHAVAVEAYERETHEVATVSMRQILSPPSHLNPGRADQATSAQDEMYGGGGGEVAEVSILAATASGLWSLSIRVDGKNILGSPFSYRVRPGKPSIERCLLNGRFVGDRKASAGVRHEGTLQLRDRVGNECEEGCSMVTVWLREEFIIDDTPTEGVPPGSEPRPKPTMASLQPKSPSIVTDTSSLGKSLRAGRFPPSQSMLNQLAEGEDADDAIPAAQRQDERRLTQQKVRAIGGGKYRVVFTALRSGKHSLLIQADGETLKCSLPLEIHADGATSSATELIAPPNSKLLPQTWNLIQLRCKDAVGNPTELLEPSRLAVTCEGLAGPSHLKLRERPGLDGAYEVLIFGEPVGHATLHVLLDGRHVLGSPLDMDITATSATAGRCYALGTASGRRVRFTWAAP